MNELISLKPKIFVEPYPSIDFNYYYVCPRTTLQINQGLYELEKSNEVQVVDNAEEANYIIWSFVPHYNGEKWNDEEIKRYPREKVIIIDNSDENNTYYTNHYFAYFKRSWFDSFGKLIERPTNCLPYCYGLLNEYFRYPLEIHNRRTIDVGCYHRPDSPNRAKILDAMFQVKQNNPHLNIQVGPVNNDSRSVEDKPFFSDQYFLALGQTKLNIHVDPTDWTGDNRFSESISQCCLTFTNTRFDHLGIEPYLNEKHIIQYNIWNIQDLVDKIGYYLERPQLINDLAWAGYWHGYENYRSENLMRYIINKVKEFL